MKILWQFSYIFKQRMTSYYILTLLLRSIGIYFDQSNKLRYFDFFSSSFNIPSKRRLRNFNTLFKEKDGRWKVLTFFYMVTIWYWEKLILNKWIFLSFAFLMLEKIYQWQKSVGLTSILILLICTNTQKSPAPDPLFPSYTHFPGKCRLKRNTSFLLFEEN